MADQDVQGHVVSKLVVLRLVLSGALVAVSLAEVLGLTATVNHELAAAVAGAVAVATMKLTHII